MKLAYEFLGDRLLTERILRKWLVAWKNISEHQLAKITVKLGAIELITATGTVFSGDQVSERRPAQGPRRSEGLLRHGHSVCADIEVGVSA